MKESNFLYYYLGACFSPYKLFFNLHTSSSLPLTLNPLGCSMQESCLSIELFNLQIQANCLSHNYSDKRHLDHRRNYFFKINTFLLTKTLYNHYSLVPLLWIIFSRQPVNPFVLQCPFFPQVVSLSHKCGFHLRILSPLTWLLQNILALLHL